MTSDEERIDTADRLAEYLKPMISKALADATKSCINCASFDEPKALCIQYKMKPPPRVIALGCPAFMDHDEIPF